MPLSLKDSVPQGDVPWRVRLRICVWYSQLLGKTAAEIGRDFQRVFAQDSIKPVTVRSLFKQFRDGRTEMCDLKRSGRPKKRTAAKVAEVKKLVKEKANSGIFELSRKCGLTYSTTRDILKKDLFLRKRSCKQVPHPLTDLQMATQVTLAVRFLQNCERPGWLERVITMDESWFYTSNPLSKMENMVWSKPGDERIQVARRPMNTKKAMLICFFDFKGVLLTHWILNGTVNGAVCRAALRDLREAIRMKRPRIWSRRRTRTILLYDDNASPHTCADTIRFEQMTNIQQVPHPPYSLDLSPCDFFLFPRLKKKIRGRQFPSVQDMIAEVDRQIGLIPSWEWRDCFREWKRRALKCIHFDGKYFEGMSVPPPLP